MRWPRIAIFLVLTAAVMPAASHAAAEPLHAAATRADIQDIRGALPAGGLPPFVLTGLGLLIAGGLAMARYRMRRKETLLPLPAPEAGCDPIETVEQLAAAYQRGDLPPELLCFSLAALLRSVLAASTGLPATRLTTEELLDLAAVHDVLSAGKLTLAGRFLHLCDLVKFAGHQLTTGDAESLLGAARELLDGFTVEERHEVS